MISTLFLFNFNEIWRYYLFNQYWKAMKDVLDSLEKSVAKLETEKMIWIVKSRLLNNSEWIGVSSKSIFWIESRARRVAEYYQRFKDTIELRSRNPIEAISLFNLNCWSFLRLKLTQSTLSEEIERLKHEMNTMSQFFEVFFKTMAWVARKKLCSQLKVMHL